MPIYVYAHVKPRKCADFQTFQHMSDDVLKTCPDCRKRVRKVITVPRMRVVKAGLSPKEAVKRVLKEDRPHYIVPGGKKVVFKGPKSTWRRQAYKAQAEKMPELQYKDFHLKNV
jgi:putative FmdB family regulatory protein